MSEGYGSTFFYLFLNLGITEPDDPKTLPKRTIANTVFRVLDEYAWRINSAIRLLAPITFVGLTALSVLIRIKVLTLVFAAAFTSVTVPKILVFKACKIFCSTRGTCL